MSFVFRCQLIDDCTLLPQGRAGRIDSDELFGSETTQTIKTDFLNWNDIEAILLIFFFFNSTAF